MRKTLIATILIVTSFLAAAAAYATAPYVEAEYTLRAPRAPSLRVAVAHDGAGEALAVFAWPAFEGEPYAATLAVMRGEGPPFELSGVWSAAFDERWESLRRELLEEAEIPAEDLLRIDACWSTMVGLLLLDPLRAVDFGCRHLLAALRAGEPGRVARGLAMEACCRTAISGRTLEVERSARLLETSRDLPTTDSVRVDPLPRRRRADSVH